MIPLVDSKLHLKSEGRITVQAAVLILISMDLFVAFQSELMAELLATLQALEGPDTGMGSHMTVKQVSLGKILATLKAVVWLHLGMHTLMLN